MTDVDMSPEQQVAGLNGLLSQNLQRLYSSVPADRPSIFTTHFLVEGFHLNQEEEQFERYHTDLRIRPSDLPHFTSYNALGHIHLRQQIRGAVKPTWYSGAPERLNLGERDYTLAVLVVEVPDSPGGTAIVEEIPIQGCTPFVKETLDGQEAVNRFCDSIMTSDPLGKVTIVNVPVSVRGVVQAQLQQAVPRVTVIWPPATLPSAPSFDDWIDPNNAIGVVHAYLDERFKGDPDRRDRLMAAFDQLYAEDETSTAEAPV